MTVSLSQFPRPRSRGAVKVLAIFAAPFVLIGTALAIHLALTVIRSALMQSWPTRPASLESVELKDPGSKSERAVVAYSYNVDGKEFNGKRISLFGTDNFTDFQKRAFEELQGYQSRGEQFPAHVNPEDPSESILMPQIRWELVAFSLLFVVLFAGVGLGCWISAYLSWKRLNAEEKLVAQFPGQPWRHRVEWSGQEIHSRLRGNALESGILALMWNLCSWPLLMALPEKIREGDKLGLLLLVFPLAGLGLLCWFVVQMARARRFGEVYLRLSTIPVRPGDEIKGIVRAPVDLKGSPKVALSFRCEEHSRGAGGRSTNTSQINVRWETTGEVKVVDPFRATGEQQFSVQLPVADGFPDSARGYNQSVLWLLRASAVLDGADFEAEFEIPVFAADAAAQSYSQDDDKE